MSYNTFSFIAISVAVLFYGLIGFAIYKLVKMYKLKKRVLELQEEELKESKWNKL